MRSSSGVSISGACPFDPYCCANCAHNFVRPSPTIYRRPFAALPSHSAASSTRMTEVSRSVSNALPGVTRKAAAYASFRRASNAATMRSSGMANGSARCAHASGPGTDTSCAPVASASPFAVAVPIRKPVYDPGPLDTATAASSGAVIPAYRSASPIIGTSWASCARARRNVSWAAICPLRHTATLHAFVAVSRARIFNALPCGS